MDETRNRIERVEQEVRVDLGAQRLEVGPAGLQRQLLRPALLRLLPLLEAHVLEHVGEDLRQRAEQRTVLAEERRAVRPVSQLVVSTRIVSSRERPRLMNRSKKL